ncbi:MAG: VacB/RNase II family 3'-5' exoribonuclease [Deltaproteobacteria bacterium]|nr:VacB/RNase II family 3'-5' exoribonuclease [Deltaproteobacteria bacterium]
MEPGDIVEFFEDKRIFCGVVLEMKGERLHVLTQTSREMTVTPKRILHVGPRLPVATLSRQELLRHLEATARKREALKDAINLEDLWDLLASEAQTVSVSEMADLWFGQTTPDQVAATGRSLREDRLLFKQKDGLVSPNPPEGVEQLKEQHFRELERQQELEEIAAWLEKAWAGEKAAAGPWKDRVVSLLRGMALWGAEAPDYAQGKAFLDKARLNPVEAPFRLLVRLGVWQEDEDLDLYRQEVPLEFSPEVLVLARQLAQSPPPDRYASFRQDLTHLNIMTIDGERTRDFDDALSLEEVPDGWRLGIHIADVSAHVMPQTPLDMEAQARGTSIYLPERRLPMLPEELSEDTVSLVALQERLALSVLVTLSADAEIKDWVIVPSCIKVARRLTYHEVDALLTQDQQFYTLSRLTRRLKERRLARGGYELKLPEVWATFTPQGDVQVVVEDQETASHQLVGEAMVLANTLASQFMAEQRIAAIYRSQPDPREPINPSPDKSLLELWQDRRRLSRVVMDLSPSPHWGLGLPCYTFATSPIRRYLDLVIHRQLLAVVSGHPPVYRPEDLEQILATIEPAMRRAGQLKTRRLRYWLLKHLATRVGQKFEALVLESMHHRYRIMLPDILLEFFMAAPVTVKLSPGDTVLVRLDRVNPREDQIKVSLA